MPKAQDDDVRILQLVPELIAPDDESASFTRVEFRQPSANARVLRKPPRGRKNSSDSPKRDDRIHRREKGVDPNEIRVCEPGPLQRH
jgi:hypothetical protein